MTPEEKADAEAIAKLGADLTARAKSLEMLYDYTKFHIGVYLTLTASYITVATVKVSEQAGAKVQFLPANQYLMAIAVLAFLLAGLAGGSSSAALRSTLVVVVTTFSQPKSGRGMQSAYTLLGALGRTASTHLFGSVFCRRSSRSSFRASNL